MADTPDLGAAEEIKETVDTTVPENTDQVEEPEEKQKQEVDSKEPKEEKVKGYWPEDWRERKVENMKGKDGNPLDEEKKEKLLKRLHRYASPDAALDAMFNAQDKISAGGMIKIPGKDATKEEIAQYRKEIGVPDDPKGYDLNIGDGLVVGEEDKDLVNSFLEAAHAGNYSQQQVTEGLKWYYKNQEAILEARYEADSKYKMEAEEVLRSEWGPEYQANRNLIANYLGSDFPEGVPELIIGARLPDGTLLANHPDIIRGFAAKARAANPIGALMPGSGTKQYDSMMAEIEKLEGEMGTDAWYKDTKKQERYKKLISVRDNMK